MNYLIGIDGGGTKTKCILTDMRLNVIHECSGGASNFLAHGLEASGKVIIDLLHNCKCNLVIDCKDVGAVVLGTAGAGRKNHAEQFRNEIVNRAKEAGLDFPKFKVVSDAEITLEGAFNGSHGAILIAGTGSIIYCIDEEGNIHRAGGCGRIIGDEGSGYSIGRKGLRSVARSMDGRCLSTTLKDVVEKIFDIKDQHSLIEKVYSKEFDIASVAPFVIECAQMGDEACENILDEESEELILHVRTIMSKFRTHEIKLCLFGSLLQKKNYYSDLFKAKLAKNLPGIVLRTPEHSPEIGAALIAKKMLYSNKR